MLGGTPVTAPESISNTAQLSKRAARRLIQRAFVLTGRDRQVRERIRDARLSTLWVLEDWGLEWTLWLDRGRLRFERRPAKKPDAILTWRTASEFFEQIEEGHWRAEGLEYSGAPELRRTFDLLGQAFAAALGEVLRNPVDENGDPLV